jgi:phosphotransferase system enzyme I (PtsI)
MLSLFGSGIGKGIAIGHAYVLKSDEIEVPNFSIEKSDIDAEIQRLEKAIQATEKQYTEILLQLPKNAPPESTAFIEAHALMLRDPLLVDEAKKIIRKNQINSEQALQQQSGNLIDVFAKMKDNYLRDKQADVRQITNRVLRNLLNLSNHSLDEFNQEDLSGKIIVGKDLSPTQSISLKQRKVVGIVTDYGSQISHTAIVSRSLGLPAVLGLHGSSHYIKENDTLIVDGKCGIILINPSKKILTEYRVKLKGIKERKAALTKLARRASKTKDGKNIKLMANIDSLNDIKMVKQVNAAGVGLFRTEFLFMDRDDAPSEQEQFSAYKKLATQFNKPIVIRTLDVGGDKKLNFDYPKKESSVSPLGLRALRLCLNNLDIFKPQLRAILRASAFGKISILLPMISNVDEVEQALQIIKQTKNELRSEIIAYDNRIRVGGMIEVPAAALQADLLAQKLDFLSIGTNDLIQYTIAIDRVDDTVNYLYDPLHPAVLALIKIVIAAGKKHNTPISLCGEMAGNPQYTKLLLGLGLEIFSMDSSYLLDVKNNILNTDSQLLAYQTRKILKSSNQSLARDYLSKLNAS